VQNDNNAVGPLRRPILLCLSVLFLVVSLSACTTARKVGHGAKHAVKDGVEAVKEGGREVKRAIKEN
jgi:predicted small secreted protein